MLRIPWRSELVDLLATAMEAAWLSPVLLLLGYALALPGVALAGLPLFVLFYLARLVTRLLAAAQLDLGRSRLLLVYLSAGSVLVLIKLRIYPALPWFSMDWLAQAASDALNASPAQGPLLLTVGTGIYLWWRTARLAATPLRPASVFRNLQIGMVAVLVSVIVASLTGVEAELVPYILWSFLWGLLALAVARLEEIARSRRTALEGYWLLIVFAVVMLVLVGGGALAALYRRELTDVLVMLLAPLGRLIEILFLIIALPLGYLIELLVALFRRFIVPRQQPMQQPEDSLQKLLEDLARQDQPPPPYLEDALKVILIALVLVVVFRLLARSLRRRRAVDEGDAEEVRESVWSLAELLASLRALWQRLVTATQAPRRQRGAKAIGRDQAQADEAALSIRHIYVRLLRLAASLGRPRLPERTPYEYLSELQALLPVCSDDLCTITEAYVQARYGLATDVQSLRLVEQAWQSVRQQAATMRLPQT